MKKANTYIISLEGKDIINAQKNEKGYDTKKRNNIFKGSLDYSLESIKISEINDKLFYEKDGKQYAKAVVNVTFNYGNNNKKVDLDIHSEKDLNNSTFDKVSYKYKRENGKRIEDTDEAYGLYQHNYMTTKEIREQLYKNGFKLDGKQYVRFKRSSGASRVGKCLFIRKDLYKKMMDWSYMGLKYGKNDVMDLASMEAYISLTTSSIIDTIDIDPKSILVIEDYNSVFEDEVMATEWCEEEERLKTSKKKTKVSNSIWDGQSLLDSSVFEEKYKDKGFLLLRNRFFKSACFNTNIQQFFRDNNIVNISQLKGFTLAEDVKDIKMITTPSSIKYLKFKSHKLFGDDRDKCLRYWIENTDNMFGLVKYEKPPTNMFEMVQTHYQLLNTLPLSFDDMRELLKPTLDYIKLLKDDLAVLRNHIGIKSSTIDNNNLDDIEFNFVNSDEMVYKMLMITDDFASTKIFKRYKDKLIESYKNNIRKGHILINGNYSVLFGNGYEMLKASCGLFDGNSLLGNDEVSVKSFDNNIDLIGIRSPHVTMGNIWCCKNTYKEEINTYFNSSNFIIHVNSINSNLLERLSGADFDSDQILISDNKILVNSAKKIYGKFLVPNDFTPKKTTTRTNSIEHKADLDIKTSKNLIGEIINLSQILNSEYWDRLKQGKSVEGLYEIISQLDVMSCIEIDKAKKESVVNSEKELKLIRDSEFISYGEITRDKKKKKVMCRPYFFKFVGEGKNYKFVKKDTPMDYLEQIIDKEIPRVSKLENSMSITELLVNKNRGGSNRNQAQKIIKKVDKLYNEVNGVWVSNIPREDKIKYTKLKKERLIEFVSKLKLTDETLLSLIHRLGIDYSDKYGNIKRIGLLLLNILYFSHKDTFIGVFKRTKTDIEILKECDLPCENKLKIYEKTFKKVTV